MVVVNLYAFEKTAAKPGVHFEELIENIDIGGPSMIRSAAKNFQDVAVVTSPADYDAIAEEMASSHGALSSRNEVAAGAESLRHDGGLRFGDCLDARAHRQRMATSQLHAGAKAFPQTLRLSFQKVMDLRYGENPHQKAAMYSDGSGTGVANGQQLQGKELSYNNIVDLQAAWDLAQEFDEPVCAIIKHTNPVRNGDRQDSRRGLQARSGMRSGLGLRWSDRRESPRRCARPRPKWRSSFSKSSPPRRSTKARKSSFAAKKNLRLVEVPAGQQNWVLKNVSGGMLVQDADLHPLTDADLKVVTKRQPTRRRKARPAVRLEGLQAREVERHPLRPRRTDRRRRRRTDEPRGLRARSAP